MDRVNKLNKLNITDGPDDEHVIDQTQAPPNRNIGRSLELNPNQKLQAGQRGNWIAYGRPESHSSGQLQTLPQSIDLMAE